MDMMKYFNEKPEYKKLKHHEYPFIKTKVEDLLSGKVKSPFIVKEEQLPPSI